MAVRLHRLTFRLGAELTELTSAHLQALCDLRMPEDADLDFKSEDSYTTSGPDGLDELAKDVTALANARGGLIIIGIVEDSQGCAESLSEVAVSDKKIGQMYNGLRARVVPYLPDISISNLEIVTGSGKGYVLIAVPGSAIAPHAVRMTSRPQYSFARRLGRTTAWLEESEIAALYRDRFRLAEEHRDKVLKVLELGSEWTRRIRPAADDRIWLEVALVPSVPAERFVDSAHISGLSGFFKSTRSQEPSPIPYSGVSKGKRLRCCAVGSAWSHASIPPLWRRTRTAACISVRRWAGPPRPRALPPCSTSRSWSTGCCPCFMRLPGIPNGPARTATSMFLSSSPGRARSCPAQCPWWGSTFHLARRRSAQIPRRFTQLPP